MNHWIKNILQDGKMMRLNRQNITTALSIGIMLMGIVHIAATFTPLIADKLALLPDHTK